MRSDASMQTISIKVCEGQQLLEIRICQTFHLPGRTPGVIWRGLAYPVLEGDRIDITGPATVPSAASATPSDMPAVGKFTIIKGTDESYLLIQGSVLDCEQAAARLNAGGFKVIRTGRYLGEPVDDMVPDWFVRLETNSSLSESLGEQIGGLLANTLMRCDGGNADLRLRLIESELAIAKAREAGLKAEISRLKLALAERDVSGGRDEQRVRAEFDALQQALVEEAKNRAAAEALALESAPSPRIMVQPRLREEIVTVFECLLPRVKMLRSSSGVTAAEFSDRRFLYVALAELAAGDEGMPVNWKKLKGLSDWLERHISNGQDDAGRLYAHLDRDNRVWNVLVSHKAEQSRDIAWLRTFK